MNRYLYFWSGFFFTVIIPIFIINLKWSLFYSDGAIRPSGIMITLLIVVLWYLKDHFQQFILLLDPSPLKTTFIAVLNAMPLIILVGVLEALKTQISSAQLVVSLVALSWLIAGIFKALHLEIINVIRREKGLPIK